jgi:hypothetical protein
MDQLEKFISLVMNQISLHPESGLEIYTVDNPGWTLRTIGKILKSEGRVDRDISDADWVFAGSLDNDYKSSGDQSKLEMLIEAYNGFFGSPEQTFQLPPADFKGNPDSLIGRLVIWYSSYCDTEWEHIYGVGITFSGPSTCKIKIDLGETHLEGEVIPDWLTPGVGATFSYSVVKDVFHAEGKIADFKSMLELFLTWAEIPSPSLEDTESGDG